MYGLQSVVYTFTGTFILTNASTIDQTCGTSSLVSHARLSVENNKIFASLKLNHLIRILCNSNKLFGITNVKVSYKYCLFLVTVHKLLLICYLKKSLPFAILVVFTINF